MRWSWKKGRKMVVVVWWQSSRLFRSLHMLHCDVMYYTQFLFNLVSKVTEYSAK